MLKVVARWGRIFAEKFTVVQVFTTGVLQVFVPNVVRCQESLFGYGVRMSRADVQQVCSQGVQGCRCSANMFSEGVQYMCSVKMF